MAEIIDITDELIADLITEMAPEVSALTGWDLRAGGVHARAVPKEDGYEEILLARIHALAPELDLKDHRGLWDKFVEYLVEANVKGAYQPHSEEILLISENVDESNRDGLRLIVAHELVHRGQHVNHPNLFNEIDQWGRAILRQVRANSLSFGEIRRELAEISKRMQLIEGHATYVQEVLRATRFPNAVIESHFDLAHLIFCIVGHGKVAQYREGMTLVMDAIESGHSPESLYGSAAASAGPVGPG